MADIQDMVSDLDQARTDLDTLITTIGTPLTAANIKTDSVIAGLLDVFGGAATNYQRCATKTSDCNDQDLFTYTGTIMVVSITGFCTTSPDGAVTLRLGIQPDATAIQYLCAASASTDWAAGTLFTITGTAADAMVATTAVGAAVAQATPWVASCVTSGTIELDASADQNGAVVWNVVWIPLSAGATLVAA